MAEAISITNYAVSDHAELLRLLLQLQVSYFKDNAPQKFQELRIDKNASRSYEDYVTAIDEDKEGTWRVLLAKNESGRIIGFIIGSNSEDEYLVLSKIGKLEDWFVEPGYRGLGIGLMLYNELEKWFKEKGCRQVCSDTWNGNELSITAHKNMGFFVSGISFSKKI